jgi:DNA topoisomerase-2
MLLSLLRDRDPFIRICNDGKGIPIQIHKHENMYVPEMLFGHLLTGSNFDDNQKRLTGGRHGYGAKLTNIFSKSFTVETVDARKKLCAQTWSNNMGVGARRSPSLSSRRLHGRFQPTAATGNMIR